MGLLKCVGFLQLHARNLRKNGPTPSPDPALPTKHNVTACTVEHGCRIFAWGAQIHSISKHCSSILQGSLVSKTNMHHSFADELFPFPFRRPFSFPSYVSCSRTHSVPKRHLRLPLPVYPIHTTPLFLKKKTTIIASKFHACNGFS